MGLGTQSPGSGVVIRGSVGAASGREEYTYARNYRRGTGQRGPVGRGPGQGERNKRTKLKRRKHPEASKGWMEQGAGEM